MRAVEHLPVSKPCNHGDEHDADARPQCVRHADRRYSSVSDIR
jgi:hypothetical protein